MHAAGIAQLDPMAVPELLDRVRTECEAQAEAEAAAAEAAAAAEPSPTESSASAAPHRAQAWEKWLLHSERVQTRLTTKVF